MIKRGQHQANQDTDAFGCVILLDTLAHRIDVIIALKGDD